MPLSDKQVIHVCKYATDKQCKYLENDELDSKKFVCLKLTSQKELIDKIMEGTVKNLSQNAQAIKDNDNCRGYPNFRHKIMGYDCKN